MTAIQCFMLMMVGMRLPDRVIRSVGVQGMSMHRRISRGEVRELRICT